MSQTMRAAGVIGVFVVSLVLLASASLSRAAQDPARSNDSPYTRGVLWKVERDGAPASHILGTLPAADARVSATPSQVRQSLKDAASFVVQVAPDRAAISAAGDRMLQPRAVDAATTMDGTLYGKVEAAGKRIGVRPEAVGQLKPWGIAALLLLPQMYLENRLDSVLYGIAIQEGKPVHGLETIDEQLRLFELLADEDQIKLLRYAVESQNSATRMQMMVEAYLQQDLEKLAVSFGALDAGEGEPADGSGSFMRRWVEQRNANLAQRMQPLLATGAFVVIGAVHLYGERGVLALLVERGFRVSRVQ